MTSDTKENLQHELAAKLLEALRQQNLRIVTAESCTGGLIAGALTEVAGSSDVVTGGFVTYSNDLKMRSLRVPQAMLESHGAVSEPVARQMASGAINASEASVAIAVTGIAGPGGATADKPVGLVHLACRVHDNVIHQRVVFDGDRQAVRQQTVVHALKMVLRAIS